MEVTMNEPCLVCDSPARILNYGILSCSACKMFFQRTAKGHFDYVCKNIGNCRMTVKSKCRACRFKKCVENGMRDGSGVTLALELENRKDETFCKTLQDLLLRNFYRNSKLMKFYSTDDRSLDEVLGDRYGLRKCKKNPNMSLTIFDWSFFLSYSQIDFFLNFNFIDNLSSMDKYYLFKENTLKLAVLCGSMRAYQEKQSLIMAPDGKEYYESSFLEKFKDSKPFIQEVRTMTLSKLIAMKITNEESVLLNLIFFCDPAVSFLTASATEALSKHRNGYCTALLTYCQTLYGNLAGIRFMELISLCHIVNKNTKNIQFLFLNIHSSMPELKMKKLIHDTFDLPGNPS